MEGYILYSKNKEFISEVYVSLSSLEEDMHNLIKKGFKPFIEPCYINLCVEDEVKNNL